MKFGNLNLLEPSGPFQGLVYLLLSVRVTNMATLRTFYAVSNSHGDYVM